jgi:hypothetical protein
VYSRWVRTALTTTPLRPQVPHIASIHLTSSTQIGPPVAPKPRPRSYMRELIWVCRKGWGLPIKGTIKRPHASPPGPYTQWRRHLTRVNHDTLHGGMPSSCQAICRDLHGLILRTHRKTGGKAHVAQPSLPRTPASILMQLPLPSQGHTEPQSNGQLATCCTGSRTMLHLHLRCPSGCFTHTAEPMQTLGCLISSSCGRTQGSRETEVVIRVAKEQAPLGLRVYNSKSVGDVLSSFSLDFPH